MASPHTTRRPSPSSTTAPSSPGPASQSVAPNTSRTMAIGRFDRSPAWSQRACDASSSSVRIAADGSHCTIVSRIYHRKRGAPDVPRPSGASPAPTAARRPDRRHRRRVAADRAWRPCFRRSASTSTSGSWAGAAPTSTPRSPRSSTCWPGTGSSAAPAARCSSWPPGPDGRTSLPRVGGRRRLPRASRSPTDLGEMTRDVKSELIARAARDFTRPRRGRSEGPGRSFPTRRSGSAEVADDLDRRRRAGRHRGPRERHGRPLRRRRAPSGSDVLEAVLGAAEHRRARVRGAPHGISRRGSSAGSGRT